MDIEEVPLLRGRVLTDKVTVSVSPEMKQLWEELKEEYGIDLPELTRKFWAETLPRLKSQAS